MYLDFTHVVKLDKRNKLNELVRLNDMSNKIRVNITVDKILLDRAKKKLGLFGGKLSGLFNAYLLEFVNSMEKSPSANYENVILRITEMEKRLVHIEKKLK